MIIIQHNRGFTDEEFDAIDTLWKHHGINFPLYHDLDEFLKKVLTDIYNAIMEYREPPLNALRPLMPKLKKFKFNFPELLKWQKKRNGYKRHALGFSDDAKSRRKMERRGLIVGDLLDLVTLAEKMKEAQWRLHLQ